MTQFIHLQVFVSFNNETMLKYNNNYYIIFCLQVVVIVYLSVKTSTKVLRSYTSTERQNEDYEDYDDVSVPLWDNFTALFPKPMTPVEDDDLDYEYYYYYFTKKQAKVLQTPHEYI